MHKDSSKTSPEEGTFLKRFFNALEADGTRYCILRNHDTLPDSLNGGDLDVLVDPGQRDRFVAVLNQEASRVGARMVVHYPVGDFMRICFCGPRWGVQVDLHTDIAFRGLPFFGRDFLFQRTNLQNSVSSVSSNDASVLALLKELLSNGRPRKGYEHEGRIAYETERSLHRKMFEDFFGKDSLTSLDLLFAGNRPRNTPELTRKLRRALLVQSLLRAPKATVVKKTRYHSDRLKRLYSPPGFTVAVMGTDGSGKSALIEAIRGPLESALHGKLKYRHLRPGLLPPLASVFGRPSIEGPVTDPHKSGPSGLVGSLFRILYYSFDYIAGYWMKVYPDKVRFPCMYVFDRYFHDLMIDPRRFRVSKASMIVKVLSLLVPKPDLILCLGTEPSTILVRKPELPLDEIGRQIEELKTFCAKTKRAVWIDTGQSIEESSRKALEAITERMAARYP